MTMRRNMARAWEIARQAERKYGERASSYIAMALRQAWEESRHMDITGRIGELEAKGFRRWQKNGMDRMYINAGDLGLECVYYKTGNIRSATFAGYSISNSEAGRLKYAKTYIDLVKRQLVSDNADLAAAAAALIGVNCGKGERIIAL